MKRNPWKRAWNTFWQSAVPAGLVAVQTAISSGSLGWGTAAFVLTSAASAGLSAIQSKIFNVREGLELEPTEK